MYFMNTWIIKPPFPSSFPKSYYMWNEKDDGFKRVRSYLFFHLVNAQNIMRNILDTRDTVKQNVCL